MTIRVLIVDDHTIFLQGLRALLDEQPGVEVVGEASDGYAAVQAAAKARPDVVVMDLTLPSMNGIEATREITTQIPGVKVLCLSIHIDSRFVENALGAGAAGYLPKDCVLDELLTALRAIVANQVYLSPAVAGIVVDACKAKHSHGGTSAFTRLTAREREVLQLLAEGDSTKEIAGRLHLSVKTVGTHREHIMQKLEISSVAGLTKYAIREGLTSDVA